MKDSYVLTFILIQSLNNMGYVFLYSVKFVRVLTDIIKLSNKSVYS